MVVKGCRVCVCRGTVSSPFNISCIFRLPAKLRRTVRRMKERESKRERRRGPGEVNALNYGALLVGF